MMRMATAKKARQRSRAAAGGAHAVAVAKVTRLLLRIRKTIPMHRTSKISIPMMRTMKTRRTTSLMKMLNVVRPCSNSKFKKALINIRA